MHSLHQNSRRLAFTIFGCVVAGTAALTTPAAAVVDIAPNATVTATSGCEGDLFYLHTTMSNPGGFSDAHFVLTAQGPATYNGIGIDIAPDDDRVDNWKFFEGIPGFVHITSDDHDPAIDFYFEFTPDCVPDETTPTTVGETIPTTTVFLSGGGLPSTGSSSPRTALVALGLLGVGLGLIGFVRSAHRWTPR